MLLIIFFDLSFEEVELADSLYREYNKELYRIALNILKNPGHAEEAVQESFMKILDNLQKIQKIPCPERICYCVVIVRHCATDILRAQTKTIPVENMESLPDEDGRSIEEIFLQNEDKRLILEKINLLSENDRRLIQLRIGEEMSFKEIGAFLGISEELANKRTQRAIQKLRKLVKR